MVTCSRWMFRSSRLGCEEEYAGRSLGESAILEQDNDMRQGLVRQKDHDLERGEYFQRDNAGCSFACLSALALQRNLSRQDYYFLATLIVTTKIGKFPFWEVIKWEHDNLRLSVVLVVLDRTCLNRLALSSLSKFAN